MIVQQNFLSKLREFGLNSYESKLWTALLSRGSSTAGELSDIANVPRSRAYDVLESLERKGFIIRKLGKPINYLAVPPEEVVDRVKEKVEKDTEMQMKLIEELRTSTMLDELSLLHKQGVELVEPSDLTGVISGRDNLHNHLEARLAKAQSSVSFITTAEGLARKMDFFLPLAKKLKAKGVKIHILTQERKENAEMLRELSKYADIKLTDRRGRFCVIDGSEVTFMLLDDRIVHPSYDMAVWVNSKFFASTLQDIFEEKWTGMK